MPNDAVIDVLNKARADELMAILQYMANHYAFDDADYGAIAARTWPAPDAFTLDTSGTVTRLAG
jgi:bacterioferritin (cytochrome b1)